MPAVILTSTEVKLLHLILDKNAVDGEVATGSVKLVQSLRRRGVEAEAVTRALADEPIAVKRLTPDHGLCVMPWGKHKGRIFADVPPSYLRYQLAWASSTPELSRKFATFIRDVEAFLNA
jgi:hypothetical protein